MCSDEFFLKHALLERFITYGLSTVTFKIHVPVA